MALDLIAQDKLDFLIAQQQSYQAKRLFHVMFTDFTDINPTLQHSYDSVFKNGLKYIIDGEFKIPAVSSDRYYIPYKGTKIPKIKAVESGEKELEFTIREVRNFKVLNSFLRKFYIQFNPVNGIGLIDPFNDFEIHAIATDEALNDIQIFKFLQCKIFKVDPESFDHSSGEPMKVGIGCTYYKMDIENIEDGKLEDMIFEYLRNMF